MTTVSSTITQSICCLVDLLLALVVVDMLVLVVVVIVEVLVLVIVVCVDVLVLVVVIDLLVLIPNDCDETLLLVLLVVADI